MYGLMYVLAVTVAPIAVWNGGLGIWGGVAAGALVGIWRLRRRTNVVTWNLLLAAALVWLGRARRVKPPGLFALYVAGCSFARIGEELLRIDPSHHVLGMRLDFYVAVLICAAGLVWFVESSAVRGRAGRPNPRVHRIDRPSVGTRT